MSSSCFWPLLLGAAFLLSTSAGAQEKEEVRVDPIPQAPGASLEKDHAEQERAWRERALYAPARKRWEGKPWAAEATALLDAMTAHSQEDAAPNFAPRFRKLLEAAADDPLLLWLAAQSFRNEHGNWRDAQPTLDRLLTAKEPLPSAVECGALMLQISIFDARQRWRTAILDRLLVAAARTAGDGSYATDDANVFVRHQMQFLSSTKTFMRKPESVQQWQKAIRESAWPDWVKLTLQGVAEVKLAWIARGSGGANTVSDEKFAAFFEHLALARTHLEKSHDLRPDRPEAPTEMITVCMGEQNDLIEIRDWFDRAVEAQFDYLPAYQHVMWAMRPRWSGSHAMMLRFGKACAATRRFDTMVPGRLTVACLDVAEETGDAREVFSQKAVRDAVLAMSEGYLKDPAKPPAPDRHWRHSMAAVSAWLAGDDELAARALKAAGDRLYPATAAYLNSSLLHEGRMRAEVATSTGEWGPAVQAAVKLPRNSPQQVLLSAFEAIDQKPLPAQARDFVQDQLDHLHFTRDLAAGDWVPLKARPGLTNFYMRGTQWSTEPDGSLLVRGIDGETATLLWTADIPKDVEIRADFEADAPKDEPKGSIYSVGLLLRGVRDDFSGLTAAYADITYEYGGAAKARLTNRAFMQPAVPFTWEPVNRLRAAIVAGKFSFTANDQTISDQVSQADMGLSGNQGLFGVQVFNLPRGGTVRIRNLAVRRPAQPKVQ